LSVCTRIVPSLLLGAVLATEGGEAHHLGYGCFIELIVHFEKMF
jgi:hypothetical protein